MVKLIHVFEQILNVRDFSAQVAFALFTSGRQAQKVHLALAAIGIDGVGGDAEPLQGLVKVIIVGPIFQRKAGKGVVFKQVLKRQHDLYFLSV